MNANEIAEYWYEVCTIKATIENNWRSLEGQFWWSLRGLLFEDKIDFNEWCKYFLQCCEDSGV